MGEMKEMRSIEDMQWGSIRVDEIKTSISPLTQAKRGEKKQKKASILHGILIQRASFF